MKMSPKRRVHPVGGRGAQPKGPTIVKGLSHKILNGIRWEKTGFCVMKSKRKIVKGLSHEILNGMRWEKAGFCVMKSKRKNCKGTVTGDSKHC